jgi:hypothetical protein
MKGFKTLMLLLFGGLLFFVTPKTVVAKQQTNSVSDYRVLRPPGNYLLATVPVVQDVVVIHYNMLLDDPIVLPQGTNEYNVMKRPQISKYNTRNHFLMYKRARDGLSCSSLLATKNKCRK